MRALACLLLLAGAARAEVPVLRLGTIIPEGSGWARELRALGREVEAAGADGLRIKWYLGGIAGDEVEMADRVRRGQLDGIVSGGMICERLAPSMRVARIPGLLRTWDETVYVLNRLKPTIDKEMAQNGYNNLGDVVVGPSILFSRAAIAQMSDVGKQRLWVWDTDEMLKAMLPEIGFKTVPLPIGSAAAAYDAGRIDGFITPAAAALGFQWSAQTHFHTAVRLGFVNGCLIVVNRAFDALPDGAKRTLRSAAARAQAHYIDIARSQEEELLGGLFQRQGVKPVPVSEAFGSSIFEAAQSARERVAERLLPPGVLQRVLGLVADYRAEHHR